MRIAERIYSLAQEQNDPALMIGAYHISAATLYYLGDFEAARKYARRGIQIWRSGAVQSPVEDVETAAVCCLCYDGSNQSGISERSPLAKRRWRKRSR